MGDATVRRSDAARWLLSVNLRKVEFGSNCVAVVLGAGVSSSESICGSVYDGFMLSMWL